MECEKLFEAIDSLNDKYISVWEDVCNIESPTGCKAGVDAVGKYFIDMATAKGWKVETFKHDVSGDVVCITLNPDAKGKPVALSGHTDTVHPVGSFGTPAVRLDETKIYGPGVSDCKGGVVSSFMAMDALERIGFDKCPVMLLLQSDEEKGSMPSNKQTINYICEKAKDAKAFLNMEGYREGKCTIVRKGIVTFKFSVHGVEAHSASCYEKGANAIAEAAHKIIELEKYKDENGLTCNCAVISGGTAVNTVPGECEFYANVRFANEEQLKQIRKDVKAIASHSIIKQCKCDVTETSFRISMEYNERNETLRQTINAIYKRNGLPELDHNFGKGGSDASDVTHYGIPCIDSLGVEGKYIHSPDEFAWLRSLAESAKRVASVVYCL